MKNNLVLFCIGLLMLTSCSDNSDDNYEEVPTYPFVDAEFGTSIDLKNLANYANQTVPTYITKNNSQGNLITDKGATLGRVLFYDKNYPQIILFHVQIVIFKPMLLVMLQWQVRV
jgi:cytochrome c peroxidase